METTKDYSVILPHLNREVVKEVQRLLEGVGNKETPLVSLEPLTKDLGIKNIFFKDEGKRLGIQSFKGPGGTFALINTMCKHLGKTSKDFTNLDDLNVQYTAKFGQTTFITATDGNHGRATAWAAKQVGQKCIVYMPKGTQQARVTHIEDLGAEVIVTDLNYDDSVELAMKVAKERNGTIILDIAYEGYEEIPTWVCQGYCLLAEEACNTMEKEGPPTHVFLQVGVGSFATSVAGYMVNRYPENPPKFISIEPYEAACAYKSAVEGKFATVGGDMNTMMAGLACGVPSTLAYPILRDHFSAHTMMSEECPANGMRLLKELGIESGECGGSGYGLLHHLSKGSEKAMQFRQQIGLNKDSRVLLINTEAATDPINYNKCLAEPMQEANFDFHMNTLKVEPKAKL